MFNYVYYPTSVSMRPGDVIQIPVTVGIIHPQTQQPAGDWDFWVGYKLFESFPSSIQIEGQPYRAGRTAANGYGTYLITVTAPQTNTPLNGKIKFDLRYYEDTPDPAYSNCVIDINIDTNLPL